MQYIKSLLFSGGFVISVVIITCLNLLLFWLPYKKRIVLLLIWSRFNLWTLEHWCGLIIDIQGREHIPDKPCLVFSKHQSTLETLVLQLLFIPHVWIVKRELLWVPFFGWSLYLSHAIAIDRASGKKALKQIIEQGRKRLQQGYWVIIFPEGTRTRPGDIPQYKIGGPMLAAKSGYDIVPVCHNFGLFWPKGQFYKKPGTARLVIGAPIHNNGQSAKQLLSQSQQWIEQTWQELQQQPYQEKT